MKIWALEERSYNNETMLLNLYASEEAAEEAKTKLIYEDSKLHYTYQSQFYVTGYEVVE